MKTNTSKKKQPSSSGYVIDDSIDDDDDDEDVEDDEDDVSEDRHSFLSDIGEGVSGSVIVLYSYVFIISSLMCVSICCCWIETCMPFLPVLSLTFFVFLISFLMSTNHILCCTVGHYWVILFKS